MTDSQSCIWDDDFLKRKDEANYLTNYLYARYQAKKKENGFVLAVNGDWGLGKSFLIDRWSLELKKSGHPVIMFNSWENDFTTEPLVAFISELHFALDAYFDKMPAGQVILKKWFNQAKAILVPTLKVAGMAALKHGAGLGMQELATLGIAIGADENKESLDIDTKEIAEKLEKVIEEELKSHNNVKKSIENFKSKLFDLVDFLEKKEGTQLPIFVFIDELDRCRPDYAIKLLEGIKHLFGIPGIHFIVATNLQELAHSIRAVYGDKFSAERYLKRFFDMEYSLPEPEGIEFAAELMNPISNLNNNFIVGMENTLHKDQYPAKNLSYVFLRYALAFDLRLRDQQQASKVLEAALLTLGNSPIHIHFLFFLVCLYQKNSQIYHQLAKTKKITESLGFEKAFPNHKSGVFVVFSYEDDELKLNVTVEEIASVYFSLISGEEFTDRNMVGFPMGLLLNCRNSKTRNALSNYIDIVRRAGNFSA